MYSKEYRKALTVCEKEFGACLTSILAGMLAKTYKPTVKSRKVAKALYFITGGKRAIWNPETGKDWGMLGLV